MVKPKQSVIKSYGFQEQFDDLERLCQLKNSNKDWSDKIGGGGKSMDWKRKEL